MLKQEKDPKVSLQSKIFFTKEATQAKTYAHAIQSRFRLDPQVTPKLVTIKLIGLLLVQNTPSAAKLGCESFAVVTTCLFNDKCFISVDVCEDFQTPRSVIQSSSRGNWTSLHCNIWLLCFISGRCAKGPLQIFPRGHG